MEEKNYNSWKEFKSEQLKRCATFQLSIDDLECDLYYEKYKDEMEEEKEELNFDY